ncbi:uncharacterized protein [Musca autumnalis]|uniref:uncharacterized protein n=1 Tax=Musca autumnalis TaxID=221902 RepID=UPI003CE86A8A
MYDDAKLLDLLKANDVLYNKSHPLAKSEHKKVVWEEIADEMGMPVDRVIKRYRALRDRFVRYKRSILTKGPENNYDHAIMEKMEFLTPFIFIKSNGGKITWEGSEVNLCISSEPYKMSVAASTVDDEISDEDNYSYNRRTRRSKRKQKANSPFDSHDDEDVEYIPHAKNPKIKNEETTKTNKTIRRPPKQKFNESTVLNKTTKIESSDDIDYNEDSDDAFCDAVKSFTAICKTGDKLKENKALHGFCQMIIATISEMSIPKQSKAMTLVTQAVMEMKMEDEL